MATNAPLEYRTTAEVAERLRVTPETLRYWRHAGKGPRFFKAGKQVLYDTADVESWVESIKSPGGDAA